MNGLTRQDYKEYLKSEHWMTLRNHVIKETGGMCCVCLLESAMNDVHHIYYCGNWYKTKTHQLIVLCRRCHDDVHCAMKEDGEEPIKPAQHFKRFFKIRFQLRSKIPGLIERLSKDSKLRRLADKRPQPEGHINKFLTREWRRQDRAILRARMLQISAKDLTRVLRAMEQVGVSEKAG